MPIVPVLRQFTYNGRTVKAGDRVEMTPVDASIHARRGNVSLTRTTQTRDLKADDAEPAPRKRRSYRRRDLVAEP